MRKRKAEICKAQRGHSESTIRERLEDDPELRAYRRDRDTMVRVPQQQPMQDSVQENYWYDPYRQEEAVVTSGRRSDVGVEREVTYGNGRAFVPRGEYKRSAFQGNGYMREQESQVQHSDPDGRGVVPRGPSGVQQETQESPTLYSLCNVDGGVSRELGRKNEGNDMTGDVEASSSRRSSEEMTQPREKHDRKLPKRDDEEEGDDNDSIYPRRIAIDHWRWALGIRYMLQKLR